MRDSATAVFLALAVTASAAAAAPDVFLVDGRRPDRVVVTRDETLVEPIAPAPMARLAAGVLAAYDAGSVGRLLRCATDVPVPPSVAEPSRRVAVVHLLGPGDRGSRRVALRRVADGSAAVGTLRLDPGRFAALAAEWPAYRGDFEDDPQRRRAGRRFVMERPYVTGAVTMDRRTPARIAESLRWVDEPHRRQREEERRRAAERLERYLDDREDPAPRNDADRHALVEVLQAGPWTDAAWRALSLLR